MYRNTPSTFPFAVNSTTPEAFDDIADLSESTTILVVEDEEALCYLLCRSIEKMGYQATIAKDGLSALEIIKQNDVSLVILDILLPGMDGYAVCSEMRKVTDAPIVMVTAMGDVDDVVRGLEVGADEYVTKPFSFADLTAKVYALLRRAYWSRHQPLVGDEGIQLLSENNEAIVRGRSVKLSPIEFKLLRSLAQSAEKAVSHEVLMMDVWGYQPQGKASILHTNIRRLREKIEEDPADPAHIITVAGFGYKFMPAAPLAM